MYDSYSSMPQVPRIPNAGGFEHNNISVISDNGSRPDDAASDLVCHGI